MRSAGVEVADDEINGDVFATFGSLAGFVGQLTAKVTVHPKPVRSLHLTVGSRKIFCLHHAPARVPRGAVVYVPPFAEEMNKSRRMAAIQSRALAGEGWHVLRFDFAGTGDSEGDFADASWAGWLDDIAAARAWVAGQTGFEPWLWGLRLGGLLAAVSLQGRGAPGLVLWQPVLSGRQHLQQFLRLQTGAEWLSAGREAAASDSRWTFCMQASRSRWRATASARRWPCGWRSKP